MNNAMKNQFVFCSNCNGPNRWLVRVLHFVVLSGAMATVLFLASCGKEDDQPNDSQNVTDEPAALVSGDLFSVSDIQQVRFAPGNLKEGGHGFVEEQYEFGGLFGWGTGNRPTLTSIEYEDYPSFVDWGSYNSGGQWRTLTWREWRYVVHEREGSYGKYGMATVYGVRGLVLLPDQWAAPPDCKFNPGYGWWKNTYDREQWAQMEDSGAVFLPAAGMRWGTVPQREGMMGFYWTADEEFDYNHPKMGTTMAFGETDAGLTAIPKPTGCSVRLARDAR